MSAVAEQVFEHALHLHYGTSPGDDLSYRVLLRWRGDERGDSPPVARGLKMRHLVAAVLVAAALVVTAGLSLWLARGDEAPILVALADPVQVVRGTDWPPVESSEIRDGDTLLLSEPLDLDIDGTGLQLQSDTMVTFDERGFGLRLGALQLVQEGNESFEINTSLMTVRVDGPARLIMQINPREREATMNFPAIARQLYLHTAPTALVLSLTLVQGRAQAESEGVTFDLPRGEMIEQAWVEEQDPQNTKGTGNKVTPVPVVDAAADNPALAALLKEVGTWDVEMTGYDPATGQEMKANAVEVNVAGPGGAWLISDLTINVPSWENSMHTIIGIDEEDPNKYVGTSVASTGGMMILEGTFDGEKRAMYARIPSEPDAMQDMRMVYSWVSDDERVVAAQQKDGEDWVTGYEIRYRRRK